MADIDFGLGANTQTGDTVAQALAKLQTRIAALEAGSVTPGVTLGTLTLSTLMATTGTAWSSALVGRTAGSTITATSSAGNALTVSGDNVSGTFTTAGLPTITLTEALAGATNTPKSSAATVTVSASATVTLNALTLSTSLQIGVAVSGTISGSTTGSTITSNIPGITVNSSARTYSGTPTGSAATIANGLVETLTGATNTPRNTPIAINASIPDITPLLSKVVAPATVVGATEDTGWLDTGSRASFVEFQLGADGAPNWELRILGSTTQPEFVGILGNEDSISINFFYNGGYNFQYYYTNGLPLAGKIIRAVSYAAGSVDVLAIDHSTSASTLLKTILASDIQGYYPDNAGRVTARSRTAGVQLQAVRYGSLSVGVKLTGALSLDAGRVTGSLIYDNVAGTPIQRLQARATTGGGANVVFDWSDVNVIVNATAGTATFIRPQVVTGVAGVNMEVSLRDRDRPSVVSKGSVYLPRPMSWGTNAAKLDYFAARRVYRNMMQQGDWQVSDGNVDDLLDRNGDLKQMPAGGAKLNRHCIPAAADGLFQFTADGDWSGFTMTPDLPQAGGASFSTDDGTGTAITGTSGGASKTFRINNAKLGGAFLSWVVSGTINSANPPRNFRLVEVGSDPSEVFMPSWLDFQRQFPGPLRFSDIVNFNNLINVRTDFATTRRLPNASSQVRGYGMCLEHQILAANLLNREPWFIVPPFFNDENDINKFAAMIMLGTGLTPGWSPLKSTLRAHFEGGNEPWNTGFGFFHQLFDYAQAKGLNPANETDGLVKGYVEVVKQVGTRVRAGAGSEAGRISIKANMARDGRYNASAFYNAGMTPQYADTITVAPYATDRPSSGRSLCLDGNPINYEAMFPGYLAEVKTVFDDFDSECDQNRIYGFEQDSYEGGIHDTGDVLGIFPPDQPGGNPDIGTARRNWRKSAHCYNYIKAALTRRAAQGGVFCWWLDTSDFWGLEEVAGQKDMYLQAYLDVIAGDYSMKDTSGYVQPAHVAVGISANPAASYSRNAFFELKMNMTGQGFAKLSSTALPGGMYFDQVKGTLYGKAGEMTAGTYDFPVIMTTSGGGPNNAPETASTTVHVVITG